MEHVRIERWEAKGLSAANLILALWLIVAAFVLSNYGAMLVNEVMVGLFIASMSVIRIIAPQIQLVSWANGLAGLWLILAPFVLGEPKTAGYWNAVIVGVVIAVLAFWNTSIYTEHFDNRHPAT